MARVALRKLWQAHLRPISRHFATSDIACLFSIMPKALPGLSSRSKTPCPHPGFPNFAGGVDLQSMYIHLIAGVKQFFAAFWEFHTAGPDRRFPQFLSLKSRGRKEFHASGSLKENALVAQAFAPQFRWKLPAALRRCLNLEIYIRKNLQKLNLRQSI